MATLNFSRAYNVDIQVFEDQSFDAVLDFTRSDSGTVSFTGDTIYLKIYDSPGGSLKVTLTSGTEITISDANTLTFDKTFTTLSKRAYYYELTDSTDEQCLMYGNFIVI